MANYDTPLTMMTMVTLAGAGPVQMVKIKISILFSTIHFRVFLIFIVGINEDDQT